MIKLADNQIILHLKTNKSLRENEAASDTDM